MNALLLPPIPDLPEFHTASLTGANDIHRWTRAINNFYVRLPHNAAKDTDNIEHEASPGYYRELVEENGNLDKVNRDRLAPHGNLEIHSERFLQLTLREFFKIIDDTIAELGYSDRIRAANTLRSFGDYNNDSSWLPTIGTLYVALRMKGFTRADLAT